MTITESGERKIEVINGLRGLAIIAVLFHHTISHHLMRLFIVENGWLGVNLFFILSGFVLYKPYLLGQRTFTTKGSILKFYKHRFLRLYPLYAFVCIISVVFVAKISTDSIKNLVETLSTLSMFNSKHFYPVLNGVFWSLNLEIWFSIIFPCLIFCFNKYGFNKVAVVIFILAFIFRFAGTYYTWTNINVNPIKDCVIARMDDFMLGIIICKLYYTRHKIFKLNNMLLIILSVLFISGSCLYWDYIMQFNGDRMFMAIANNILQIGFLFLIVIALKEDNVINKIFRLKPLQLAGLMCFSLYAWHGLLLEVVNFSTPFSIVKLLGYYFFTFVISVFTYRYIEFGSIKDWKKIFLIESASK
ncbi:MAG TPA: acyltransferase [Bacteroidia bacterium]|jgi:peptidoglycan/LPS O-acetylase OafA/YrhL|nr:acyltransferase [Bacteroidia bacterium]